MLTQARVVRRWWRLTAVVAVLALITTLPSQDAPAALPTALSAPRGIALTMDGTTPVLSWSPVAGAGGYRVEIAPRTTMLKPSVLTTTLAKVSPRGLLADTEYFVRIAAVAAGSTSPGASSAVTRVVTSGTAYKYRAPALSLPSRTATSITLTWKSLGTGLRYEVQRSASALMTSPTSRSTTATKLTVGSLTPKTSYWWRGRVVSSTGAPLGPWTAPSKRTTLPAEDVAPTTPPEEVAPPVATKPLIVGTYNITCLSCGGSEHPWTGRRAAVADTIRKQAPDIFGIQEASTGKVPDRGVPQFQDLLDELGGNYALHSTVREVGPNRIVYNRTTIELLRSGGAEIENSGDYGRRYVVWALVRQKSTGKQFFFTTTHLDPGPYRNDIRIRQVVALLKIIADNRPAGVPSIVVGDFNSHKWTPEANAAYDKMLAAGYVDPLGNAYQSKWTAPGATVENRIHTNYYSYNHFYRSPKRVPYYNGLNIDYIFVTPMRVSEYETVVDVDAAGDFVGIIPSDHNMLRATVWLP